MKHSKHVSTAARMDMQRCRSLTQGRIVIGLMNFEGKEEVETGIAHNIEDELAFFVLLEHAVALAKKKGYKIEDGLKEVYEAVGHTG